MIDQRVPGHGHDIEEMRKRRILIDGSPETGEGLLLQIFTENMVGPIFFEIIQRKGNEGFGEGNFKALFESIELDQIRRGVIPPKIDGYLGYYGRGSRISRKLANPAPAFTKSIYPFLRSEKHTSELKSLIRISSAVF